MSERKVSNGVLESIEFAGWQNKGIEPSTDREGMFTAHLIDPECKYIQNNGFEFDGTSDGLSDAIKQCSDSFNNIDINKVSQEIADTNNSDINIVRAELARYSADIDRLYTCVELSCIKEEIQELKDIVEQLRDIESPQKESEIQTKQTTKSHNAPDR